MISAQTSMIMDGKETGSPLIKASIGTVSHQDTAPSTPRLIHVVSTECIDYD